ncbi:hypothetical protein V6N12_034865 [Hibiscus sabdariffa]|uniref:Uncharacterized protein n=1 Tax=Hibiscus sabdariffa TaxID=183260 RepID=A0ABR2BNU6_9ROSI
MEEGEDDEELHVSERNLSFRLKEYHVFPPAQIEDHMIETQLMSDSSSTEPIWVSDSGTQLLDDQHYQDDNEQEDRESKGTILEKVSTKNWQTKVDNKYCILCPKCEIGSVANDPCTQ